MALPARLIVAVVTAAAALLHGRAARLDARAQATLVEPARFHHLHLVAASPVWLADYYTRLFPPAKVTRGTFWSIDGVRGQEIYLLVSPPAQERQMSIDTAIWHFGWGSVSLGETYKRHYAREVNWKPPYPRHSKRAFTSIFAAATPSPPAAGIATCSAGCSRRARHSIAGTATTGPKRWCVSTTR